MHDSLLVSCINLIVAFFCPRVWLLVASNFYNIKVKFVNRYCGQILRISKIIYRLALKRVKARYSLSLQASLNWNYFWTSCKMLRFWRLIELIGLLYGRRFEMTFLAQVVHPMYSNYFLAEGGNGRDWLQITPINKEIIYPRITSIKSYSRTETGRIFCIIFFTH